MTKITLAIIAISSISLFAMSEDEETNRQIPIIEVSGDMMPGWEKQIIEQYHDEEGNAIPVIFRGAAKNWGAASWTPEYFAENFGDTEIIGTNQISAYNDEIPTTFKDHINDITLNPENALYFDAQIMHNSTWRDFIFVKTIYFNRQNSIFIYKHLKLSENTNFPQSVPPTPPTVRSYFVFIGSENTASTLHNHGSTFLAQLYGSKQAVLIHPKDIDKCGCIKQDKTEYTPFCYVDIAEPDFEEYPEFKEVDIYYTIVEPGDILYIPHKWLHDIRALTKSITISSGF